MRNLIYKELKLSWHPITYVFIFVFPLMVLIPSYPCSICFFYICALYPILFLGANKGQQSNDIFYSVLLPVRKKDIVFARMTSLILILFTMMIVSTIFTPFGILIQKVVDANVLSAGGLVEPTGFPRETFLVSYAFVLIGFAFYDFFFLVWFYKSGRSILLPSIIGPLVLIIIIGVFNIVLPIANKEYYNFFVNDSILIQIVTFFIGLAIYAIFHILAFKIASKEFEKVDL